MQVIVPSFARDILGEQTVAPSDALRPLSYLMTEQVPEGSLVYNVMTGELILADEGEHGLRDYLARNWFLVPQGHDDRKLALELREVARLLATQTDDVRTYTVLTTTACNARCPYCYEKDYARATMDRRTAEAVADYIEGDAAGKKVSLRWFGGEPLCNTMPIDLVSERLRTANFAYSSHIATNGYLISGEIVERAVDLWHLRRAQITLDGTEEAYNRCKGYVNAQGSPFRQVLANIDTLLDAGVKVDIRLNLSEENGDDLLELVNLLGRRFGSRKGCSAYAATLYGLASEKLEAAYRSLNQMMDGAGILQYRHLPGKMKFRQCIADSDSSVVISPLGNLSKCEHYSEPSDSCGTVYEGATDKKALAYWQAYCDEQAECGECLLFPQCMRVKGCPAHEAPCDSAKRKRALGSLRDSMLDEYRRLKADNAS